MKLGGRDLSVILRALAEPKHLRAAANMFRVYRHPLTMFSRYLLKTGTYPATADVKTPLGPLRLRMYTWHDLLTINEIFCRLDYRAEAAGKVVVDFGSNIGISAAYFLTRSPDAFVYLYEPLPNNLPRLRQNLEPFAERYALTEAAVGLQNGEVSFGWEESGRYGGVNVETGRQITVPCVDSVDVLRSVLRKHGRIDILKIDIEGLEQAVIQRIPLDVAERIGKIYAEASFARNPLPATHRYTQSGMIAELVRA